MNYYNEIDPFAAAWLRELIKDNQIAPGEVDERDIRDVSPVELVGYRQCHFFAGIGAWSYALRCAGWPDDRPVWTGSCPCQPFSAAGKRTGTADERHLWPAWFHLVEQCRPPVIFGEQVEAAIKQNWLDLVQDDLEGIGYSVGAHGIAACHLGAPHIRKRLYFVADSTRQRLDRSGNARGAGRSESPDGFKLGNSDDTGLSKRVSDGRVQREAVGPPERETPVGTGYVNGFWQDADWIYCTDQKYRPVKSGIFPLAHGVANRVGLLRGAGNAIVAPVAEEFIRAYMEVCDGKLSEHGAVKEG